MVTIEQNARKFAKLASFYPNHNLGELLALMVMPPVDISVSVWRAKDLGLIETNDKTGKVKILGDFDLNDEAVDYLKDRIMYAFKNLGEKTSDMDDHNVSQWFAGYPSHDFIIAMQELILDKKMATYIIVDSGNEKDDVPSEYLYYTLFENLEHHWGTKQFKRPQKLTIK